MEKCLEISPSKAYNVLQNKKKFFGAGCDSLPAVTVRDPYFTAEPVRFRYRQYSLDERRNDDSGTDSIVWMREEMIIFHYGFHGGYPEEGVLFFARYARQATVVLARAGICRATDSDRLCLELPAGRPPGKPYEEEFPFMKIM